MLFWEQFFLPQSKMEHLSDQKSELSEGTWLSEPNLMAIHPIVCEVFQSGTKWPTSQQTEMDSTYNICSVFFDGRSIKSFPALGPSVKKKSGRKQLFATQLDTDTCQACSEEILLTKPCNMLYQRSIMSEKNNKSIFTHCFLWHFLVCLGELNAIYI